MSGNGRPYTPTLCHLAFMIIRLTLIAAIRVPPCGSGKLSGAMGRDIALATAERHGKTMGKVFQVCAQKEVACCAQ